MKLNKSAVRGDAVDDWEEHHDQMFGDGQDG